MLYNSTFSGPTNALCGRLINVIPFFSFRLSLLLRFDRLVNANAQSVGGRSSGSYQRGQSSDKTGNPARVPRYQRQLRPRFSHADASFLSSSRRLPDVTGYTISLGLVVLSFAREKISYSEMRTSEKPFLSSSYPRDSLKPYSSFSLRLAFFRPRFISSCSANFLILGKRKRDNL